MIIPGQWDGIYGKYVILHSMEQWNYLQWLDCIINIFHRPRFREQSLGSDLFLEFLCDIECTESCNLTLVEAFEVLAPGIITTLIQLRTEVVSGNLTSCTSVYMILSISCTGIHGSEPQFICSLQWQSQTIDCRSFTRFLRCTCSDSTLNRGLCRGFHYNFGLYLN